MMNGMACGSVVGGIAGIVLAGLLGVALLLLVLGAVWFIRHPRTPASGESNEALAIVRREYASGRINRDEYLERSGYLTSSPS